MEKWLLDILICPDCKSKLKIEKEVLICSKCNRRYNIVEGIPVFESVSEYSLRSSDFKVSDDIKKEIENILPSSNYPKSFVRKIAYYIYDSFVLNGVRYHYMKSFDWLKGNIIAQIGKYNRFGKLFGKGKGLCFDIACGNGAVSSAMGKLGYRVVSVDADFRALLLAKERFSLDKVSVALVKADVCNLPFRSSIFDIGLSVDTIEHVPDGKKALLEMWRILKGKMYIHTPNQMFPLDSHDSGLLFVHWLPFGNFIAKIFGRRNIIYNPKKKRLEWGLNKYFSSNKILKILDYPKVVSEFFPEKNSNVLKNFLIKVINLLSKIFSKPKTAFTGSIDIVVEKK